MPMDKLMTDIILVRLPSYINLVSPPLGIGYLLKSLAGLKGINPVFIDAHLDRIREDALLQKIAAYRPLVIGFHIFSVNYAGFRRILPKIRRLHPKTKIIAGGPHVSGLPEQTLIDNPDLDFVIKGEGEEGLNLLVKALLDSALEKTIEDIPNLVYRNNHDVVMNEFSFVDVNKYASPDWTRLEPHRYPPVQQGTFHKSSRVVPILTSRGCPYPCTYCAGHLITGKKIRTRDINSVVDEIQFLQAAYGFEEMVVQDENFTFHKEHVISLSNEIKKRNIKCYFSFPNGVRLDRLDEETVYYLRRMGTYMVTLGIESGSPKTLKAMKKDWNLEEVKEKIRLLKKNGITILGCFILGFSDETLDDIRKSINFAIESDIDTAFFGNYIPLPGSEDFNRLLKEGELKLDKINWDAYTSYFGKIPYHPKDISKKRLLMAIRYATIKFYCRPKIIYKLLKRMTHLVFLRSLILRIVSLFRLRSADRSKLK